MFPQNIENQPVEFVGFLHHHQAIRQDVRAGCIAWQRS
jgi:hypothetical protein